MGVAGPSMGTAGQSNVHRSIAGGGPLLADGGSQHGEGSTTIG